MLRLTLDTNCIINLERGTGQAASVRRLVDLHREGVIQVFVSSVSASESQPGGLAPSNFSAFEQRLETLGLETLPRARPVLRYGMSFYDEAVWGGDDDEDLESEIRGIVHPNSEVSYADYVNATGVDIDGPIDPKWRNKQCDIDGLVAHIREGHDVFVTEDRRHFLAASKLPRLIALGAQNILTPDDALTLATSAG